MSNIFYTNTASIEVLSATDASGVVGVLTASYAEVANSASFAPAPTNAILQGGNAFAAPMVIGSTDDQPVYIKKNDENKIWIAADGVTALGGDNTYTGITLAPPNIVLAGHTYMDSAVMYSGILGYQAATLKITSVGAPLHLAAAETWGPSVGDTIDNWYRAITIEHSTDDSAYAIKSHGNLIVFKGYDTNIPADLGSVYAASLTGSLNGNADTATTAAFATQALSASWAPSETSDSSSYSTFAETANFATTAGTADTASYVDAANVVGTVTNALTASYVVGGIGDTKPNKVGVVSGSQFAGNPKKATVTFTTPFADGDYGIQITGEASRAWSIEDKVSGSFVINSNSNTAFTSNVYFHANPYGEYNI